MARQNIRRLILWNRVWAVLFALVCLAWWGSSMLEQVVASTRRLNVYWNAEGGLKLGSVSDGPFIVTHLIQFGRDDAEHRTFGAVIAPLPEPLAVIDSGGARVSAEQLQTLTWRNHLGDVVRGPEPGEPVRAVFTRPEVTRSSDESKSP